MPCPEGSNPPQTCVHPHKLCCATQVVGDVLALNGIARHLKAGRADNGALRLDNTKLFFKMDEHGNPVSAGPYGEGSCIPQSNELPLILFLWSVNLICQPGPTILYLSLAYLTQPVINLNYTLSSCALLCYPAWLPGKYACC